MVMRDTEFDNHPIDMKITKSTRSKDPDTKLLQKYGLNQGSNNKYSNLI